MCSCGICIQRAKLSSPIPLNTHQELLDQTLTSEEKMKFRCCRGLIGISNHNHVKFKNQPPGDALTALLAPKPRNSVKSLFPSTIPLRCTHDVIVTARIRWLSLSS